MTISQQKNIAKITRDFFAAFPQKKYEKNDILLYPSNEVDYVFYITKGNVSEYDISPNGSEVIVNIFKSGAFFPMSTVINKVPSDYFFEATEAVEAHIVPAHDAINFIKSNPEVMYDLLSRVYRGTDGILRRMAHLMGGNATTRLLYELSNSAHRYGVADSSQQITLPLNENDLAKRSGLTRETVNRTMKKLKQANLIKIEKNIITINDLDELERTLGSGL